MTDIGKAERVTQNRVAKLFVDELGYKHLGDWTDRVSNSNIEKDLFSVYMIGAGYSQAQINAVLHN